MEEKYKVALKNSSILLAEDDEKVRKSFKKVLLLYVGEVFDVSDGEEAYNYYKKYNPNIIITDVKMPKLNGIELIKLIRQSNENIPIVITSAYTDQDLLLESIKLSLIDYIVKPIKESELNSVLIKCATNLIKNRQIVVSLGDNISYDFENKIFTCRDENIKLTHKEIEFFELLLSSRGKLVTKEQIEDKLYIYEEAPPSALKNLVFKLRKKIGADIVKTTGSLGYKIN